MSVFKTQRLIRTTAKCFVPACSHAPAQIASLFDHVVRTGEQCWRDLESKRLRSFQVDDQVELRGQFDRKVCRAFPFEDATDIVACAPEQGWVIRSIRHQPPGLDELPGAEQSGNRILVGETYDRFSVG